MNIFTSLVLTAIFSPTLQHFLIQEPKYEVEFLWNYINITWLSPATYKAAITNKEYIPENVVITGIQYWNGKLFFCLPRFRPGVPVTLAYLDVATSRKNWPRLTPYPDYESTRWSSNLSSCSERVESALNLQVDPETGYLWILDGLTSSPETRCPPKIVILDLNNGGKFVLSYELDPEICVNPGCVLNGIRIDHQSDKTYAYISDSGSDPGLIVFLLEEQKVWKLQDSSMNGSPAFQNFSVDGVVNTELMNIDGIALTPSLNGDDDKLLFYSALSSLDVYAISNKVLIDPQADWQDEITHVGRRFSQGDDMIFDEKGTMYFSLLPLYSVGIWHFDSDFERQKIWIRDREAIIWGESFCFDEIGNLRLLSNDVHKFANPNVVLELYEPKMRVVKVRTNTKSYLY